MNDFDENIRKAVSMLRDAERVAAFTGAGISTESGLSDFRSPGGVWDRHRIVTYQEFLSSKAARQEYWRMKSEFCSEMQKALPNEAHRALADMQRAGKLSCLITQNIDGLHQAAGSTGVIELHGTNREAVCVRCGKRWPISEAQAMLEPAGFDPRCDVCTNPIKPATISFGQSMPEDELALAFACASRCDLFLMIGSSLQVEPAASLPRAAHQAGAQLIFINRSETPWDRIAAVIFRAGAGEVLPLLAAGIADP